MTHALILQIAIPLLAAPLCVLTRSSRVAAGIAVAVAAYGLVNALLLLSTVLDSGVVQYLIGGVAAPYGIEYRLDLLGAFVLVVVATIVAATTLWAAFGAQHEIGKARGDLFFAAWLLCGTGLSGIVVTGDLFNVFVFLEISSLSGYVLVAHGRERRAVVAAFRYLLLGTVGASCLLIGIGLLYMVTGTLNMQDLAARLPELAGTKSVRAAWAFLSVGLCLKAAVFPLHLWLPGAYATAPTCVSALLAGTATKVALFLWLRLFFGVFAGSVSFVDLPIDEVLLILGATGALVGSLVAIFQDEPKRLLAWSSIGQIGIIVVGISLASQTGLAAATVHLWNHGLVKAGAFLALGAMAWRLRIGRRPLVLRDLHGLGRTMPVTSAALLVAGLALIGMPLTAGFVSKWLIVSALLEQGLWLAAALVLAGSLFAVIYVWRLFDAMYLQAATLPVGPPSPQMPVEPSRTTAFALAVPTVALCGAGLVFGIATKGSVGVATEAVVRLLEGVR
jgi:multicomponent Na+:H+ antiporter subunit D